MVVLVDAVVEFVLVLSSFGGSGIGIYITSSLPNTYHGRGLPGAVSPTISDPKFLRLFPNPILFSS